MKKISILILLILSACATAPRYESSATIPALNEANYKDIMKKSVKLSAIYFYHSSIPTDAGDLTLREIMKLLRDRVDFYRVNIKGFSQSEEKHVAENIIGAQVLPSYIFFRNDKILLKIKTSKSKEDDAVELARNILQGFEEKNWYQGK